MKRSLKQFIASKPEKTVVATWTNGHSDEVIEVAAVAGFDFIIVDGEHGLANNPDLTSLVRTAEASGIMILFRTGSAQDAGIMKRYLDAGACGILAPNVETKQDAIDLVRNTKFAPLGNRGCCPFYRSNDFGEKYGQVEYYQKANEEVTTIALIESAEAVKNIDEILSVDGLDGVLFGRVDMAASMGIPGQYDNPELNAILLELLAKAKKRGLITGMFCLDSQDCRYWKNAGLDFVTTVSDRILMLRAFMKTLAEIR